MYGRGMTVRDINNTLGEIYGIEVSDPLISSITDKILPEIQEWQSRPLEPIYVIAWLDCIHVKIRMDGKVKNRAVYNILGLNLEGKKEILGTWISKDGEGANYWLSVLTELQNRGVQDILICCVDGLKHFNEAIKSVYPEVKIQRCIIHEIRNSLRYVNWKDRKAFVADLKNVYQAPTEKAGWEQLENLSKSYCIRDVSLIYFFYFFKNLYNPSGSLVMIPSTPASIKCRQCFGLSTVQGLTNRFSAWAFSHKVLVTFPPSG